MKDERMESLKAGMITGATAIAFTLLSLLMHGAIAAQTPRPIAPLPIHLSDHAAVVSLLGAGITGFLFGVTYRYVIRQDQNPQLQSGATLAFGLARGLAQMEVGLALEGIPWAVALLAAESLIMVAIARFVLDLAFQRGWVKLFEGMSAD